MAHNATPQILMEALARAMEAASQYADEQEELSGQDFGLLGFCAEIIDRLGADGWQLVRVDDDGIPGPRWPEADDSVPESLRAFWSGAR